MPVSRANSTVMTAAINCVAYVGRRFWQAWKSGGAF